MKVIPMVLFSGYLVKRGHLFPTWRRRYFEICEDGFLKYYSEPGGRRKGCFQLNKWTVIDTEAFFFPEDHGFSLRGNLTSLYMKADSEEEKETWLSQIRSVLQRIKDGDLSTDNAIHTNRTLSEVDIDNSMEMSLIYNSATSVYSS